MVLDEADTEIHREISEQSTHKAQSITTGKGEKSYSASAQCGADSHKKDGGGARSQRTRYPSHVIILSQLIGLHILGAE